ncbi:MAG: type IV pilus twitching motility protein PilT [Candidatus Kerfeldbacteria bacterium]|nr:type IV pilus twitching motility protein PilT [Candidatus Kerfeldbacteria bacterium]
MPSFITSDQIDQILALAASHGASDVHLLVGHQPLFRIDGALLEVTDQPIVTPEIMEGLVFSMLTPQQKDKFLQERELDLAYQVKRGARFRVNIHWEKGNIGLVARVVKVEAPTMEELRMPEVVYELTRLHQGLILVTGPTGCGKSTSLAAMVELINRERKEHIVTLEDPIEYMFTSKKSIIRQRELYRDFLSFATALKHVVRQDPNIIMVGEMRDLETIAAAITVAETGHLVLATLHTLGAAQTIDRIIDVFPPHQQDQIRLQLSMELRAVISQQLLPKVNGGRVAAREIMMSTPAIGNLIRENKLAQIRTVIQTSAEEKMVTLDQDLKQLYQAGLIERTVAESYMDNKELLG